MQATNNATDRGTVGPDPRPAVNAELLHVQTEVRLRYSYHRTIHRISSGRQVPRRTRLGAVLRWIWAAVLQWIPAGCPSIWKARGQ
jgi:hypothetical protein